MYQELASLDSEVGTFCDTNGSNPTGLLLAIGSCLANQKILKEDIRTVLSPVIEGLEETCHV
jgi:hypothetical protein